MRVAVYTIPHTGTRFLSNYLRSIGSEYSRRHVNDPKPCREDRYILTVRNPYDCYLSHRYKNEPQTDAEFIALWGRYIWDTERFKDKFYFPLDVDPEKRQALLSDLADFCDCEYGFFPWTPVGESKRDRTLEVPDDIKSMLSFAYEWYLYYTENYYG